MGTVIFGPATALEIGRIKLVICGLQNGASTDFLLMIIIFEEE